jgi:branched-chain amino acid transport system substrate-binding protein
MKRAAAWGLENPSAASETVKLRSRLNWIAAGLAWLLILSILGCGAGRTVVVGSILCLTGEGAYYGKSIQRGMDLALERVNDSGGVGGNPLQILYRDSGSSPEEAAKAAVELYDRSDVPVIVGGVLSSVTLRIAPLAQQRHKILLSPASSSPEISRAGRYVFRVYPSDGLEGAYMAQLAQSELNLRRITVLAIDNAFGRGLAEVFDQNFRGTNSPEILTYPARGADFRAVAERARDIGGDGIYLVGYHDDMASLLREMREQKVSGRILSTSSFGNPRTLQRAGDAADGVIFPATVFDPDGAEPAVARFVDDFQVRYGSEPDLWAAHGYDAVMIVAEAIRRAGGPAPDRIAEALFSIQDYQGASGILSFDLKGDVVQYPRAYIVDGGRFVLFRDYLHRTGGEKSIAPVPEK